MKVHLEYIDHEGNLKKETLETKVREFDNVSDPFGTALDVAMNRIRQREGWNALCVKRMSVSYEDV